MINYHNPYSHRRARGGPSSAGRGRGSAPNQMLLDFDRPAEMEPTAKLPAVQCPVAQFARRLATLLESDPSVKFDNRTIGRLAQEISGSSAGHGRDAYDAAETGFNIFLQRMGLDLGNVSAAIDKLLVAQARLPLQTRRDQTQIEFQQFSTPPAEALVVVKAAALCPGMSVLEPSAGYFRPAPPLLALAYAKGLVKSFCDAVLEDFFHQETLDPSGVPEKEAQTVS